MDKTKAIILGKQQWDALDVKIAFIEKNQRTNPNIAIDGIKSLLETVAKTILSDNGDDTVGGDVGPLIKKAIVSIPHFADLDARDIQSAKKLMNAFMTAVTAIGELRNEHGDIGHGQDVDREDIDHYLLQLAISSGDLLCSFLIQAHHDDLRSRFKLRYEDNPDFNEFVDSHEENVAQVQKYELIPSRSLFTDVDAYKEALLSYRNSPDDLIDALDVVEETDVVVQSIFDIQSIFDDEQIKRLFEAVKQHQKLVEKFQQNFDFTAYQTFVERAQIHLQPALEQMEKIQEAVGKIINRR